MNDELYNLTNPQKSIWLTEQFYKGSSINNICGTVLIDDVIDFNKFCLAINILIRDNDAFRIRLLVDDNGNVKQYFSDYSESAFIIHDILNYDGLIALETKMATTPFNIIGNDLYNFQLFRFPNGKGGFVLSASHLIVDACTASLIATKVTNIYSSLLKGEPPREPSTSYINYINSENEYLSGVKFEKDKEYWDSQFETSPEFGIIPSLNEPSSQSSAASRQSFIIDSSTVEDINVFCKTNKISLFNFFMGVYAIYIGKVSNLNEFVLGTPILNRTTFVEKNTPGMFISTVPFKFVLNGESTFVEYAQKIAMDSLSMFRHQKYPYQNILEHIRTKNPSQPNLYDILISYQNSKTNRNSSDIPYVVRWTFNNNVADSMQIHLFDMNDEGTLEIAYDYRLNKYNKEDVLYLHDRILYIINQIISNSCIRLSDIDIVTPSEKSLIINEFNNTYMDYPSNKTVVDYFEAQVEKTPNNIALVFQGKTITYSELNNKVNSLAKFLNLNGVGSNCIVGIMVSRSFEMIISILAVLKAGAAYIPIDSEYPEYRIKYILDNSNCNAIITLEKLSSKVKSLGFNGLLCVADLCNEKVYNISSENLHNTIKQSDLSYLIFTSGSTGNPKGVILTHKNLNNFINSMFKHVEYLNDGIYHSIISITTMSFDIFAFETIVSLCSGLKVFITDDFEQKITSKIERIISDNNIEIIQSTPSIMNFHLDNAVINGFSKLKYIVLAGEQLPKSLVDKILLKSPTCTIYNGYGPSETTIFSTITDVTHLNKITIGKPIANTQIYILNNNYDVLPINSIGELYIAGDGVGKGYINNPELTSKRYIQNPFMENSIMYKTGDIGFWNSNGTIICKGRADNQVKLRGLRVELGEIESQINSYNLAANINSAVIIKCLESTQALVAYISSDIPLEVTKIREFLASKLPNYMMPSYFIILDKLPLTPNGKINRKELESYNVEVKPSISTYSSPRNEIEEILVSSIKKKLGIINFGIDDNIFDYGADSLSIINILTDLFQYKISLKVYDFYKYPTVRELYDKVLFSTMEYTINDTSKLTNLNLVVSGFTKSCECKTINDKKSVLLTGATGFLGIHILAELLNNIHKVNKIYCLVRPKYQQNIYERLLSKLHFYFGNKYDSLYAEHVVCVNADMISDSLDISEEDFNMLKENVDLVIHSAANVKHYGDYSLFEDVNINGTKKIIDLCKSINVPLHYISTMTISGNYLLEQNLNNITFTENSFFINQDFSENVYSKSKLIAESLVLEAISEGITATIYRIGDLSSRYDDGHFQSNITENAIYTRLKSILEISAIPDTILDNPLEFTPVDYASKALFNIIWSNNNSNRIYHIYNPNMINTRTLLDYMNNSGYSIHVVSQEQFIKLIQSISTDALEQSKISGIINDFTKNNDMIYNHIIKTDNSVTCSYLHNLGFEWPILDFDYFVKLIQYMKDVGFIK